MGERLTAWWQRPGSEEGEHRAGLDPKTQEAVFRVIQVARSVLGGLHYEYELAAA